MTIKDAYEATKTYIQKKYPGWKIKFPNKARAFVRQHSDTFFTVSGRFQVGKHTRWYELALTVTAEGWVYSHWEVRAHPFS